MVDQTHGAYTSRLPSQAEDAGTHVSVWVLIADRIDCASDRHGDSRLAHTRYVAHSCDELVDTVRVSARQQSIVVSHELAVRASSGTRCRKEATIPVTSGSTPRAD